MRIRLEGKLTTILDLTRGRTLLTVLDLTRGQRFKKISFFLSRHATPRPNGQQQRACGDPNRPNMAYLLTLSQTQVPPWAESPRCKGELIKRSLISKITDEILNIPNLLY